MGVLKKQGTTMRRASVRKVTVDIDQVGQRVDNFLRRELPGVPRSRLYRIVRKGEVRVNGGRIRPEYRLKEGDQVRIPPAKISLGPGEAPRRQVDSLVKQIVFEDKSLLVLNKPSGIAVHGGSGVSHGAIELLRAARPELRDLSLVHRIDRDTSGCLVFAKKRSVLRKYHEKLMKLDKLMKLRKLTANYADSGVNEPRACVSGRGKSRASPAEETEILDCGVSLYRASQNPK